MFVQVPIYSVDFSVQALALTHTNLPPTTIFPPPFPPFTIPSQLLYLQRQDDILCQEIMRILKAVTGNVEKDTEIRNSLLFSVTLMAWLVLCHVRS